MTKILGSYERYIVYEKLDKDNKTVGYIVTDSLSNKTLYDSSISIDSTFISLVYLVLKESKKKEKVHIHYGKIDTGITEADLDRTDNKCSLCGKHSILIVDNETGAVRAWCRNCNTEQQILTSEEQIVNYIKKNTVDNYTFIV